MKWLPRCQLTIGITPNAQGEETQNIVIPPEFTVDFAINRQNLGVSQTATFRIYGLKQRTRDLIFKDPYAITSSKLAIQFRAGYADAPLSLCFNGFIQNATSEREGEQGSVTTINAYDGGVAMANGWTSQTIYGGQTIGYALQQLAKALPRTSGVPIIGSFPQISPRGKVLFGNIWQLIVQESGNLATIDNNQVKILQPNEGILSDIPVINSASGLLGTPRRMPTSLEIDMLFEPRLTLAALVQVESKFIKNFSGTYKIQGFTHSGTISPAVDGAPRVSKVQLFFDKALIPVSGAVIQ